jgi:predicted dehydrogenase
LSTNGKTSVLIAGLGSIGQRHLNNLYNLGYQDIILYRTGNSTLENAFLQSFPVYYDLDDALANKPDAVIISNPTSFHVPVALKAGKAGCHLFIEKPVSHSFDGLHDLIRVVEATGIKVFVGFQFRFHPSLKKIKSWLEQGLIGRVLTVVARWGEYLPGWHPWEDYRSSYSARRDLGGGVLLTLCHPFDYLRWLLGDVRTVSGMSEKVSSLTMDTEDVGMVTMKFESGAVGFVYVDYFQRPPQHNLSIIGEQGRINWDNESGDTILALNDSDYQWKHDTPEKFERNNMFLDEMIHFMDCVTNGTQPECTLDDGVKALEIVLAAKQSATERKYIELQ